MVAVVPCLNCLHGSKSEVKDPVFTIHQSICIIDDLAPFIAVFYQINCAVIRVAMGNKNQICREIVALTGIRINIDDLVVTGNNPQTPVSLIQKSGGIFRRIFG